MNTRIGLAKNPIGVYRIAIILIALVYLLQMCSPLRLNTDAVTLLSMATNANAGHDFTQQGHATQFPLAFPIMLLLLIKLHLARSSVLVGLNICCLWIAVWQFAKIASGHWRLKPTRIALVVILFLLSFTTIKHVTVPLTEMPFAAVMMLALRCMLQWNADAAHRWHLLVLATILTLGSIEVRMLGIALLPALVWSLIADSQIKAWLMYHGQKPLLAIPLLIGFVAAATVAIFLVTRTKYFHDFASRSADPKTLFKTALTGRLTDATELFCNLPIEKLGHQPLSLAIGVIPIALVLAGLGLMKKWGPVEVFLVGYAGILTVWPYRDARFWIPVLPFAIVLVFRSLDSIRHAGIGLIAGHLYAGLFSLIGLAALGYSSKLSLAGDRFADLYGTPVTRATYEFAFGRPFDPTVGLYPDWVDLLRRYEPRARHPEELFPSTQN